MLAFRMGVETARAQFSGASWGCFGHFVPQFWDGGGDPRKSGESSRKQGNEDYILTFSYPGNSEASGAQNWGESSNRRFH